MRISVYTTKACVQCESTKRMMNRLGIRFDEIALENHPELAEQFREAGYTQAPIVVTDNRTWSGFRFEKIQSLANHLFGETHGTAI